MAAAAEALGQAVWIKVTKRTGFTVRYCIIFSLKKCHSYVIKQISDYGTYVIF